MVQHRILLATPATDTAMLLLGWLVRQGFYVGMANDVAQLGDLAKLTEAPECLLLDDALGPARLAPIVRCARQVPSWEHTAILVMGHFSEEQETDLFRAGADDVIFKPLRVEALALRLIRSVRGRNAQKFSENLQAIAATVGAIERAGECV